MSPARLQICFGAWIIALTAVFYALPQLHMYAWAAIGFPAAAAVLIGVRKYRPSKRLPWYLLSAMIATFTAGDTAYNVLTDVVGMANPCLARTLDFAVVAEGIELDGHRAALVEMGCQYGQGYLFSKPVTPEEFLFAAQGTRGLS